MPSLDPKRLQLSAPHQAVLHALLMRHVPTAQVWVYGSRVTGGCHEGSDLDLVLRNTTDLTQPVEGSVALREALQNSALPFIVDVHDWSQLTPAFHQSIEQGYIELAL